MEILKCFPKDSLQSLAKLQDVLSDDQICAILNCSDSHTANKMILDCLINKMNCKEDVFNLCDQLNRLTDISPNLTNLISKLRKGYWLIYVRNIICEFISTFVYIYVYVCGGALVNVSVVL